MELIINNSREMNEIDEQIKKLKEHSLFNFYWSRRFSGNDRMGKKYCE